jgi:hypothetical protein
MSDVEDLTSHYDPMGPPPEDVPLMISILTELARQERRIRIASSRPAVVRGPDGIAAEEPASALGYTVSSELLRLVGHPEAMGAKFPVTRAIRERVPEWCAKNHRIAAYHDGGARPLCADITSRILLGGFSVEDVFLAESVKLSTFDRFLRAALREVWFGARETMIHG